MRRSAALLAALSVIGLLAASPASAAYQQVSNFAGNPGELHKSNGLTEKQYAELWPEKVQLGGVGGMAVNYTGAGGVPVGTLYTATVPSFGQDIRVARYNPDGSFSEAWQVTGEAGAYERCGPDGDPGHPHCLPRPEGSGDGIDVDVDQTTGNVYVFRASGEPPGTTEIEVFNADGSEAITRFGELADPGETFAESPGKVHVWTGLGEIAVNATGEVYVFDLSGASRRLMVFRPKTPGNYTEYEYAGQSHDIGAGEAKFPANPVTDAAGDVYTASETRVEKYDPATPSTAVCSFSFKKGGIRSMTVNPKTGEVFFYSYIDDLLHRLNPCEGGTFSEAEALEVAPKRDYLSAMAIDPERVFGPGRAAGVLYGGAPSGAGGESKGTSPNTEVASSMGYVFAPPVEASPSVLSESVSAVTPSSARLEGRIDPKGNVTHYAFQYISDAAYQANEPTERFAGALEAPLGGARVEGSKAIPVATTISGLQPGSEYHYRIVAISHCSSGEPGKECLGEGAAKAFRTYPLEAAGLPDNRAWELVSPVQKNGGQVIPAEPEESSCGQKECKPGSSYNKFPMQSAPDGNAIAYEGSAFSFDEGALIENEYIARRTASGWQSVNLTPSRLASKGAGGYMAFKADLSESVLEQINFPLSPEGPAEFGNLYTQPVAEPASLTPFLTEAPFNRTPGNSSDGLRLSFAGASADFSRFFFAANDTLTPEAEGGPEAKRNLYERSGGELHLVNFAPGDATTIPGASFGGKSAFHAISEDGSRAFWSSESGQLYVRIDGGETREVKDPGEFLTASADGSKALLDDGCLYVVEVEACEDLTQGEGGFEGIAGQSEDLSRIYFVDAAVLSGEEENAQGAKAKAGKHNLYVWNEGATIFVATLPGDTQSGEASDWAASPAQRTAEASPDGRRLAFLSTAPLTGYDNVGPCGLQINNNKEEETFETTCPEIFLYDSATGDLSCPSCNPTGAPPKGAATLRRITGFDQFQPRYLLDSGRLYFDSEDSLSPFDTNGRVEDVYEFEPNGVGSCASAAGCVRLISAGRFGSDANFLAADPSGRNVFFTARERLVSADEDNLVDLYDAREGGGFPPEAGSAECQGEACLPSVSPPSDPTPASAGFKGPSNPATGKGSGRCPKGRHAVKRKGKARCVKSQAKRHHKRAHNNRGGAK